MKPKELRTARRQMGLSQTALGKEIGLTQTYISMMERGVKPIEKRTAMAVELLKLKKHRKKT